MSKPTISGFSAAHLPFGIFSTSARSPRVGVAYQDWIIDMTALAETGIFAFDTSVFYESTLNAFIALGKDVTIFARTQVQGFLSKEQDIPPAGNELFVDRKTARLHLPLAIGDYTDFYSSREHAENVGKLFRDPENALLPNWRHLPVGYHGRASSIVVSGTDIRRPKGQVKPNRYPTPRYEPTSRLDFELELAFVIGKDSQLGRPVPIAEAEDYIFGVALFNDWSARDIQKWEYVPLGPFLGKNFASSISPWITPLEALSEHRAPGPPQEPAPLEYLLTLNRYNLDIQLEVKLTTANGHGKILSRSNAKHLYWSMAQQLAHHTVNGCNMRVGDVLASGTISGPDEFSYGSLLELSKGGRSPINIAPGVDRTFLEDGDILTLSAWAGEGGGRIQLGEVVGTVLPAIL